MYFFLLRCAKVPGIKSKTAHSRQTRATSSTAHKHNFSVSIHTYSFMCGQVYIVQATLLRG